MSATILDPLSFCKSVGLPPKDVKFIMVDSDFPESNRLIHPMRAHPLNRSNLQEPEVRAKIARTIDEIMNAHKNHKGIIHTTSYAQNNFIIKNLSEQNADRLIPTDPHIPREEIILKHINSNEPTVLISPSLYISRKYDKDHETIQAIVRYVWEHTRDVREAIAIAKIADTSDG